MSGSLHFQALDAAIALLKAAAPALADGGVVDGPRQERPVPEQFAAQVFVSLDFSKPERAELQGQPDDWMTRLRVECAARATAALRAARAADALAVRCYVLLAGDPSLGGLAIDLVPVGLAWDAAGADVPLGVAQVLFDIKHRTPAISIAA
jgi:hypothetical protein